jgi:hypothetical protein
MVLTLLSGQLKQVVEQQRLHQFVIENSLAVLLAHFLVYCKSSSKDALLRAATASDRVGLLAIVNRLPSSDGQKERKHFYLLINFFF